MDCNKNNNDPNRLITVAIHTFDRAVDLKNTLEEEGIEVEITQDEPDFDAVVNATESEGKGEHV